MQSFLSARSRVNLPEQAVAAPSHALSSLNQPETPAGKTAGERGGGQAEIECVREGDKIVRLRVKCGCGECIEIDCLYGSGVS